jgi:hypothetical protein
MKPIPSAILRSPLPSQPPPVRNITAEERPAYIASRLTFPDATIEEIKKPSRIQAIQASLACTLRTPLEDIRILSMSVDGVVAAVIPALYALSSNGTVECYKIPSEGVRRLQVAARGSVTVDYTIANPPDQILALSPQEFTTVVQTSTAMTEVAQSVGSSGVEAIALETAAAAPTQPAPRSFLEAYIGGGVGGGGLLVAIGSVVAYVIYKKKQKRKAPTQFVNPMHQVTQAAQPVALPLGRGSTRVLFGPTQVRGV